MLELYEAAFSGVNVVYTTLLLLTLLYWVIVILGVIDLDAFGLDFDVDADAGGLDADGIDAHDGGLTGSAGGFSWLAFFNVGEAPIMFYASIVVLTMWIVSIQSHHWIDAYGPSWASEYHGLVAAGLAVPNFIFALFVAKFLMLPIKRLRQRAPQRTKLVGKVANVTSLEITDQIGRVEMPKQEGSLILNARTEGGEVLQKGDAVEIVRRVESGNGEYFVVTKKQWT
jgi:hypothetical protein